MALLSAILAFLFWRRRRAEAQALSLEGPSLALGVRKVISDDDEVENEAVGASPLSPTPETFATEAVTEPEPSSEPTPEPAPTPEQAPKPPPSPVAPAAATPTAPLSEHLPIRLDHRLEITNASRSVMMFTLDFRIEIANRSDKAVRDLNIAAQMAFAQRGASNGAPVSAGQPIGEIERIGPHQSRGITGSLTLPLAELKTIRQGSKPLFIPLLHITCEGAGQPVSNYSYVVGTPSAASADRVHPLTLDGPPGGIPGLRAQLIK